MPKYNPIQVPEAVYLKAKSTRSALGYATLMEFVTDAINDYAMRFAPTSRAIKEFHSFVRRFSGQSKALHRDLVTVTDILLFFIEEWLVHQKDVLDTDRLASDDFVRANIQHILRYLESTIEGKYWKPVPERVRMEGHESVHRSTRPESADTSNAHGAGDDTNQVRIRTRIPATLNSRLDAFVALKKSTESAKWRMNLNRRVRT